MALLFFFQALLIIMSASHPSFAKLVSAADDEGISKTIAIVLIDPFLEPIPLRQPIISPNPTTPTKRTNPEEFTQFYSPPSIFNNITDQQARSLMILSPTSKGIDKTNMKRHSRATLKKSRVKKDSANVSNGNNKFHKRKINEELLDVKKRGNDDSVSLQNARDVESGNRRKKRIKGKSSIWSEFLPVEKQQGKGQAAGQKDVVSQVRIIVM